MGEARGASNMGRAEHILASDGVMWVCGHRGAPASGAVENTMASFEAAVGIGAELVEFDVRMAGGGIAVVFHDRTLKRLVAGDTRALGEVEAGELASLRVGGREGGVPTLRDVLATLKGRTVPLVELKEHETVPEVVAAVDALGMRDQVLVQSFLPHTVKALADAGLRAGLLVDSKHPTTGQPPTCEEVSAVAAQVDAQFVGLAYLLPDATWMQALAANGLRVAVWTVNAVEDMRRMQALGVHILITDNPAAALALRNP